MCNLHWCYTFCTGVTLFALVLHLNCTALSQSESNNFFMCIIRHKIAPTRIQKQFQDISNIHPHYTRSSASNNLYTQSSRLSIKLNSFSRTGSTIWKGIFLTLRSLRKNDFTRKITTLVFDILISGDSSRNLQNYS